MAKRLLSAFLILSFFFGVGYFHKHFRNERSEGVSPKFFAPVARVKNNPQSSYVQKNSLPTLSHSLPIDRQKEILKSATGAELFSFLFDGPFDAGGELSSQTLQVLKDRFREKYSQEELGHYSMAERQATDRLGILKAWGKRSQRIQDKNLRAQVVNFFESVAANKDENLSVRREALKSLVFVQHDLTEKQRMERMARQDRRLLGMAAVSDEQMIEALLEK
jgi:hypothetical protein